MSDDTPDLPAAPVLERFRFAVGDRVLGPDAGRVAAQLGPYSVLIERERDGVRIASCALRLERAPAQNDPEPA